MKINVGKDKLLKSLQKITNIISTRSTLPILANVLIEAKNSSITLTTTDLEIRVTTKIEAKIETEGKTTIPAKKLLSIVSKFIDNEITMDCNDKHHTEVKCGSAKFRLLGLASDDFPLPVEFNSIRKLKFNDSEFSRILNQISYAVSLDDSRKVLHGILCSVKDNTFTAVATDGKRLALVEKMLDDFTGTEGDIIIPLKSVNEVKRMLEKEEDVIISIGEKQASFESGSTVMTTKLIEGNYPNYRQVIPASFSKSLEIPTSKFVSSLELVSIALSDNSAFVKLSFSDNKLMFNATSTSVGEGTDVIDIEYSDSNVDISFNPVFLADPCKHSNAENVTLRMNDGYSPVAIEGGDGFLYVIMPMRNK